MGQHIHHKDVVVLAVQLSGVCVKDIHSRAKDNVYAVPADGYNRIFQDWWKQLVGIHCPCIILSLDTVCDHVSLCVDGMLTPEVTAVRKLSLSYIILPPLFP